MNEKPRLQFSISQLVVAVIFLGLCIGLLLLGKANWEMKKEIAKLRQQNEILEEEIELQKKYAVEIRERAEEALTTLTRTHGP